MVWLNDGAKLLQKFRNENIFPELNTKTSSVSSFFLNNYLCGNNLWNNLCWENALNSHLLGGVFLNYLNCYISTFILLFNPRK